MTPAEYLKAHKPLFALVRYMPHSLRMLRAACSGRTQAFREAPTWAVAWTAMHRGKAGESSEARSIVETAAFYAEKEFARRVAIKEIA